ncbi:MULTISPECIES: type I-D CRISPR-associated protein Cas7/Csc2 [unclassified Thermosipho (in: thermotogales)]|uniref:type I-D CRISPR-associated protein Cas7/Csc2 n=1 Tax=unclassified Thermosipho (in: thermotogales) TaxID=2676525 RepID=UPI0009C602F6|nr:MULTISPECIES: type I-D CRISPR-associated protein Cas7/Csc2 [unclassified Thermosipho (in: thermotogales)]OOC47421.1 hypothetical protein XO09_01535 [Thermosipho sp. 1223]
MDKIKELLKGGYVEDESFPLKPLGKYIHIILRTRTLSETIFRTDEGLTIETVKAGINDNNEIQRVIMSKRKRIAAERRIGREFLMNYKLKDESCEINQSMCGRCLDCTVYGFAAGEKGKETEGALKSRVITENAYSILPYEMISDVRTFNALSELGTMMEKKEKKEKIELTMRQSLGENEYIKPEVDFIDIETLKDLRFAEVLYALGNILRTKRYGAIDSRLGKVKNEIIAIIISDAEIFGSLELTKKVWDKLEVKEHILEENIVDEKILESVKELLDGEFCKYKIVEKNDLKVLKDEIKSIYLKPEDNLISLFKNVKSIFDK